MCGIAGWIGPGPGSGAAVASMLGAMVHRGPDGHGWMSWSPGGGPAFAARDAPIRDGAVVFGHLRLSIIDLSEGGHQPMASPDGRWHVIYNGELYNYLELRRELEATGATFRSNSDTEVLLQAWQRWGPECLPRLVGMYAFAVLDVDEQTVTLVRDPFGVKPLCYWTDGNRTLIASDVPGLLASGAVPRRIDTRSLHDFLRWAQVDCTDRTLVEGVRQVPAGHLVVVPVQGGHPTEPVAHWSLPDPDLTTDLSIGEAAEQLRDQFIDSVRLHVRSDVAVGCALSGGIDSSAILLVMRQLLGPDAELHAFSYIPDDPLYDEERWIDLVANRARATVHKVRLDSTQAFDALDAVIVAQGEPFPTPSIIAQHHVFQRARMAGVTVLLDGQGADELFGGYRSHVAAQLVQLARTGHLVRAGRLAVSVGRRPDVRLERTTVRRVFDSMLPTRFRARREGGPRHADWLDMTWYGAHGVQSGARGDAQRLEDSLRGAFTSSSLPGLLRYEDRNSMAWSRESRVPFLTPALVDLAFRLPAAHKIAPDGTTKVAFRAAMRGIVPDAVLDRRDKIGFTTPRAWEVEAVARAAELLADTEAAGRLGIDVVALRAWATRRPSAASAAAVWRAVNAQRWAHLFEMSA